MSTIHTWAELLDSERSDSLVPIWSVARLVRDKRTKAASDLAVSPENVEPFTGRLLSDTSKYEGEGWAFQAGDVLFNKLRTYLCKVVHAPRDGVSMGEMIVLRPERVDSTFFYYTMLCDGHVSHLSSLSSGVKQPRTDPATILDSRIPVPPLNRQRELVDELAERLQAIDKIERSLVRSSRDRIKLRQDAIRAHIPWVQSGSAATTTEFVPLWSVARLIRDKAEALNGSVKISPENVESGTGVVRSLESAYTGSGVPFRTSDTLFNKLRTYLAKVVYCDWNGYSMGEMLVIRPEQIVPRYLYYTLSHPDTVDQLSTLSTGVKQPRTDPSVVMSTPVCLPDRGTQERVAHTLSEIDDELGRIRTNEERRLAEVRALRRKLIAEMVFKAASEEI
ncbi:MAG: hypothetical protein JJ896_03435 [Rhodothermales bacterium]|nr:hypothetical protein [Rhodothermales bacterium]MBO6778687.1 hypothetical protein [Rhodothermales bacterium]